MGPRVGPDDVEKRKFLKLPGLELRSLGRLSRSQSLYRLSSSGSIPSNLFWLWSSNLVFGRRSVRMLSGMSSVLSEVSRDFPQSLQENVGIIPPILSSSFSINHTSLIIPFEGMSSTDWRHETSHKHGNTQKSENENSPVLFSSHYFLPHLKIRFSSLRNKMLNFY
jgi:hypothetical protein